MNTDYVKVLSALAVIVALPTPGWSQSRRGVSVSGALTVGWGPSMRHNYFLNRYYTGLSDLSVGYSPAAGSGALGSSIYSRQSMTRVRSGGSGTGMHTQTVAPPVPARGQRIYDPRRTALHIPSVSAPVRSYPGGIGGYVPLATASAGTSYLAVGAGQAPRRPRKIPDEIITTLVPEGSAVHREQMIKGEEAFRAGKYSEALAHFETARRLSNDSPESLLSLGRASFATAEGSYTEVARYLSRVLEVLPEVTLVKVFPRSFYGNQEDYLRHVRNLTDHVKANPEDAQAKFVLGYLRGRQGKGEEARKVLGEALDRAEDEWLHKGIKALLGGIAAGEQTQSPEPPEMDELIEYPYAGIRLALPRGFRPARLDRARQVLSATRIEDGKRMNITLAAQAVGKDVTPRALWEWAMGFWRASPAVSDLRLVEERDVSIADLAAVGRLFTYSTRGVDAAALGLCFIRQVNLPDAADNREPMRVGYALLVTSTREQMASMIAVINAVAQSTAPTEIRRPVDIPMEMTDFDVRDLEGHYSLRVPRGWTSGHDETSVVMNQRDFLLGGVPSPAVRVVTLDVPESMSAKACGESAIEHAATQQGNKVKILSQGRSVLGRAEGYQFVLEKQTPLPVAEGATPEFSEPFIEVARMVGVPAKGGRKEFYVVIVTCYDCQPRQAETIMDAVASGFALSGA